MLHISMKLFHVAEPNQRRGVRTLMKLCFYVRTDAWNAIRHKILDGYAFEVLVLQLGTLLYVQ